MQSVAIVVSIDQCAVSDVAQKRAKVLQLNLNLFAFAFTVIHLIILPTVPCSRELFKDAA